MKNAKSQLRLVLALAVALLCGGEMQAFAAATPPAGNLPVDPTKQGYESLMTKLNDQIDQLEKNMSVPAAGVNDAIAMAQALEQEYSDARAKAADAAALKAIAIRYAKAVSEVINLRRQFATQADMASAAVNQSLQDLGDPKFKQLAADDIASMVAVTGRLMKVFEPVKKADVFARPVLVQEVRVLETMTPDLRDQMSDQQKKELRENAAQIVLENKSQK
jgi:hypothetical protein